MTIQCCTRFNSTTNQCGKMVHYECYMGFLSLLSHECKVEMPVEPLCCNFILYRLEDWHHKIERNILEKENGEKYITYTNLFLHDFMSPSHINPFDVSQKVKAIPRGVVGHYDIITLPLLKKVKPRSNNMAEEHKETPPEVKEQEKMLTNLQSDDPRIMIFDKKKKPIPRYLYFKHFKTKNKDTGKWNVDCNVMGRIAGHDDRHKDRETKQLICTDLDRIISKDTHL